MNTALVLVATTCLAGSLPGWEYWDGGDWDGSGCIQCSPSYDTYYAPDYGYCYDPYRYGCWNPYGAGCYAPAWDSRRTCCPHDNCLDRLRDRLHRRREAPPPCWGWDPYQNCPSFGGGVAPYESCGWGPVLGASRASGWWCPDGCGPKEHAPRERCLKRLCERWRHKREKAPCFNPGAGPWDGCDDCFGGPPVAWGDD